jgi:DNA-binding LacI/PurR family transcriptional regulator
MKKVTIYTLSKELGVSPATISKALNNSPELNEKTASNIRKKADEYGFKPRPLVTRTTNICALIQTPNASTSCFSPFTVDAMQGMMDYLQENDLEFSLFSEDTAKLNAGLLLRQLGRRNINGAVLINTDEESGFYAELDKNRFPYCSLLTNTGKTEKNLLTIDNEDAAMRAIEYLVQLGHRKIAVIVTPAHGVTGRERLAGYKNALKNAGIAPDPALVVKADSIQEPLEFGHRATQEIFRANPGTTALFVMGERIAIGAMHALNQLGKSIPNDVSLISCDDAPEASYLNPPLTVMRIPNRKLGFAAARWVHQMISGSNGHELVHEPWMRGELVVRESTAPAPVS